MPSAIPIPPKDSTIVVTDNTSNDVSTSKHGWAPKAPNDATKFLRGDATWAVPAGGMTNPLTTAGDIIYSSSGSTAARLAAGTLGQHLGARAAAAPVWEYEGQNVIVLPWDFIGPNNTSRWGINKNLGTGSGWAAIAPASGIGGIGAELLTGTTSTGSTTVNVTNQSGSAGGGFFLTDYSYIEAQMDMRLPTLSDGTDTFLVYLGIAPVNQSAYPANGLWVAISTSTISLIARASSSNTSQDSATSFTAGTWFTLKMSYDGTTLTGSVNGAAITSITTGFPSATLANGYQIAAAIVKSAGSTSRSLYLRRGRAILKY